MNIHYTYINHIPIPIYYSKRDPRHLWVNMAMKGYLNEEIVYNHLCYLLDKKPPKGLVEAILAILMTMMNVKMLLWFFDAQVIHRL